MLVITVAKGTACSPIHPSPSVHPAILVLSRRTARRTDMVHESIDDRIIMRPSHRRPHYALQSVRMSVCLSV